jgi:hypothetical protein
MLVTFLATVPGPVPSKSRIFLYSILDCYLHPLQLTDSVGRRPVSQLPPSPSLGEKTLYY